MNLIISVIIVFHLFRVLRKKFSLKFKSKFLIILGVCLPSIDYFIRYLHNEPIFSSLRVVFQSLPYQTLFWGMLALLYWIYKRNFHKAGVLLLPLTGMIFYFAVTAFTPEKIYFLQPLSDLYISFNLIRSGYILPFFLITVLWFAKRWIGVSATQVSQFSLYVVAGSLLVSLVFKTYTYLSLPDSFTKSSSISISPADHSLVNWNAIELNGREYYISFFRLLSGWSSEMKTYPISNDYELLQSILLSPEILCFYSTAFQTPIAKISVKNENLHLEISELSPLKDLLWMDRLILERNRTGHILQSTRSYKSLSWELNL